MAEDSLVSEVLGGSYRVDARLAGGGMGAVYRATHVRTGRAYAVKTLLPEMSTRPGAVERFDREARALALLGHPGIVAIQDRGVTTRGVPYLVMDLLEGEDLGRRIERRGPIVWADACRWVAQAATALDVAHRAGFVHRDVKPSNLFLVRAEGVPERIVVLDFGIAKLMGDLAGEGVTSTTAVVGTPMYLSPEQARNEALDSRSDVWSLGAVLYEALVGRPPFTGPSVSVIIANILAAPAPPLVALAAPGTPAELDAIVQRCLEKDRSQRFASAADLARALDDLASAAHAVHAGPSPFPTTSPHLETSGVATQPAVTPASSAPPTIDAGHATTLGVSHVTPSTGPRGALPPSHTAAQRGNAWVLVLLAGALVLLGATGLAGTAWYVIARKDDPAAVTQSRVASTTYEPPIAPTPAIAQAPGTPPPTAGTRPTNTDSPSVEPRQTSRQALRAHERSAAPALAHGTSPSPQASSVPAPPRGVPVMPDAYLTAIDRLGHGDAAGCLEVTEHTARSERLLALRMNCATSAGNRAALRGVCRELEQISPSSTYVRTCQVLLRAP